MQGAWLHSLVGELGSHLPVVKTKKRERQTEREIINWKVEKVIKIQV